MNDFARKSKYYVREKERIDSEVERFKQSLIYYNFQTKEKHDAVLEEFVKRNQGIISFDKTYLQSKFLEFMSSLSPEEFISLDEKLEVSETNEEILALLFEFTDFNFTFFKNLSEVDLNRVNISFELSEEEFIFYENCNDPDSELELDFNFNWFTSFTETTRIKYGVGLENVYDALQHLSYYFSTDIVYTEDLSKFIYVKDSFNKKRSKSKRARKIPRKNYEEKFNQRYLFSSKDNAFYHFIEKHTESIYINDRSLVFITNHKIYKKVIISI